MSALGWFLDSVADAAVDSQEAQSMPSQKPKPAPHATPADTTHAVDEFMRTLDHPFKSEIQAIRTTILAVDPTTAEGRPAVGCPCLSA